MADCCVVDQADARPLLVVVTAHCGDGTFMGQVLETVLSWNFNKLPEVRVHDSAPVRYKKEDILSHFAVVNIEEFVSGEEFPMRKVKGHLMYHAGVHGVAAIRSTAFPLMRGRFGDETFHIPRANSFLLFVNAVNTAIRRAFDQSGATLVASAISCSHGVWSDMCKRVQGDNEGNGIITCTVKRGTKRARHHVMSRPSVVSIACDVVVLKVKSLKKLQEIFGKKINILPC